MISADTGTPRNVRPASPAPRFRQSALAGRWSKQPHSAQGAPQPQCGNETWSLNTPRSTPASVPISAPNSNPADTPLPAELQIAAKMPGTPDKSHHRPNADINFTGDNNQLIAQAAIPMVAASRSTFIWLSMR